MRISVCICTLSRQTVLLTVRSIFGQVGWARSDVEIVVCDDDPSASARSAINALIGESPVALKYVWSGKRDVAASRNKCLEVAGADWIMFIDDDQTAEPTCLLEMKMSQARFGAHVVKAHVRAIYPSSSPKWILAGDPFTRRYGLEGTPLRVAATNGVLFNKSFASEHGIKFDPRFGRTGGEDIDFFNRFHLAGAQMISCDKAIVNEHVPAARMTAAYLRHRGRRNGNIRGRSYMAELHTALRVLNLGKSLLMASVCSSYPFVTPISQRLKFYMFSKFWLHVGILEWALGRSALTMEL